MSNLLFIDTETTGKPKDWDAPISDYNNWPRLVEVAWIVTDENNNTITESEYIIYPKGFKIPKKAVKIHGITTKFAKKEGNRLKAILKELKTLIKKADFIIGHNIEFDTKILGAEFYRKDIKTKLFKRKHLCTMKLSTDFCEIPGKYGYKWPSLSELHDELFNESFDEAHNALSDIRATRNCFWELVDHGWLRIKYL